MASNKRYSLIVVQDAKEKVIPILNRNPNDVKNHLRISTNNHLSTIDLHTLTFSDEKEFLKGHRHELKIAGINPSKKVYIKIAYNANKKRYFLDPVYKDKIYLKGLALETETNIDLEKISGFIEKFMTEMHKATFYRYLSNNHLTDERLMALIDRVLYKNDNYCNSQIETELRRYKVVRRILLGLPGYQKDKKEKLFDFEKAKNEYKEKEQISIFDLMKDEPNKDDEPHKNDDGPDKDDDGGGGKTKKLTRK